MTGDRVHEIALAWLVLSITGSPLTLASVLIAGAVPRAGLLLVGGALTDRFSARALMLISNAARGLLALALAILVITGRIQLWTLYLLEVSFGVADAFFYPAVGSIIPAVVEEADVVRANALVGTSEQVTRFVGPAIGGVLVGATGSGGAFVVNGLSFFVAACGLIPSLHLSRAPRSATPIWADIKDGLAEIWFDRQLRAILGFVVAESLTYSGVFAVAIPALARNRFSLGASGLGTMLAAWGVGQLMGTLSAGTTGLPRRWGVLTIVMTLAAAVAFTLLGVTPTFWAVPVVLAALGFGVAYSSDVALPSWIQRRSRPQMLGRVNSVVELVRESLAPISFIGLGLLANHSVTVAFIAPAAVLLITALVALSSPTVRQLVQETASRSSTLT